MLKSCQFSIGHWKGFRMERPCVRGSEWLLIYYWHRKGPQTLRPFSLKERKVRSPLTYMCLGVRSHMGWGIFSYSILASFPLAWDKITGELLTLSFPACMCGYGQGKLVSWVWVEISWTVCFLWAIYIDAFWTIFVFEGFLFFMISAYHFLQVITLKQFCRGRYSCWHPA